MLIYSDNLRVNDLQNLTCSRR